jgi:Zn-dependent protease
MRFSRTEISHILIAIAVLTIAFAFAFNEEALLNLSVVVSNIPLSFVAIFTAFFCHELAHKYMGMKYGYWSEFRMFPQGLFLALFLGVFLGVVFAAPGAVQIFGHPNRDQYGKISAAGPAVNLLIAFFFLPIAKLFTGLIGDVASFISYINAFLALFNLLPFGPLDGLKVFRWKMEIWVGLFAGGIVVFFILLLF